MERQQRGYSSTCELPLAVAREWVRTNVLVLSQGDGPAGKRLGVGARMSGKNKYHILRKTRAGEQLKPLVLAIHALSGTSTHSQVQQSRGGSLIREENTSWDGAVSGDRRAQMRQRLLW